MPPGRALELEILEMLREGGFRAELNAGAARPRQTDIYAHRPDVDLLVEVKDRKSKVDVADIDNLRSRLRRTASDVVGVIFTKSPITRGALKEIESDRAREIIVFTNDEIEQIHAGRARFLNLVERKREELRVQGRAWFRSSGGAYLGVQLPSSTIEFFSEDKTGAYFCSRTGFAHCTYVLSLPDTGWGAPGGEGVRLSLRLTLSSLDDMKDLLGYLHDRFGLSSKGIFSIHQSDACWHGIGADKFVEATSQWRHRYRNASMKQVHHSEDLMYFDQFRDGWLSLNTRQRVDLEADPASDSHLYSSELCIQLPGVPVDSKPFVDLCRYTGNDWAHFAFVDERRTHTRRLKKPIKLQVMGTAVEVHEGRGYDRWVVGLIARNPFYKKKLPKELELDGSPMHDLLEMELLLCDVRDHVPHGDTVDGYFLEGVETTDAHHVQILRPFGTWNKITKRAKSEAQIAEEAGRDLNAIFSELDARWSQGDRRNIGRATSKK